MKKTKSHYESHTAQSYESAFFYEKGAYAKYLRDLVLDYLCLKEKVEISRRLLDIGGGTGNFTRMIVKESPNLHAVVVDPFLEKQSEGSSDECERVRFAKEGAEIFLQFTELERKSWWRQDYHQVLLKEVVHHFKPSERSLIFKGIRGDLNEKFAMENQCIPSILIITRPQRDIDYPLWREARDLWAENQPNMDQLLSDLTNAGFNSVECRVESYPCAIALERWHSMIKQRFWSTFAHFSDAELETACETIARSEADRLDEEGRIHFEDRLLFLTARR